jgi:ribosomal protein L10
VQVSDLESLRRELPEGVELMITKNRLLRVAVDNLPGDSAARWAGLRGQKGQNAYVFAKEDSIRDSVKAYNSFLKRLTVRIAWGSACPASAWRVLPARVVRPQHIACAVSVCCVLLSGRCCESL